MKLIALYQQPDNPEAFDSAYFGTHIPLIEKVPGLQSAQVTRFTRTIAGDEGLYMMSVMQFADKDALKAGLRSPEMVAAGENLDSFAKGMYTLMYGEDA